MKAVISNIQGFSIHDGPGIRTVVFFKGCPLRCRWCANPECISPEVQVGFIANLCAYCHKCFSVCPEKALTEDPARHRIDDARCTGCGKCVDVCDDKALVRYGTEMRVGDVFDAVSRDKMFYGTGGGVTVSGGEPLLQPAFVRELFELCKNDGIGTCVETCGFVPEPNLLEVLPLADHLLFDLKHMDPELHRKYTGQSNDIILRNASLAAKNGADIVFRIPLIPGVNNDDRNITATSEFVLSLPGQNRIQLMPYHRLGESKYKALGKPILMHDVSVMTPEQLEAVKQRYIDCGIDCTISK
jgi:pyruvate formate lyase activating enzyme